MKTNIEYAPNPTIKITLEMTFAEIQDTERWMGEHTGPEAPTAYQEILVTMRKALDANLAIE